MSYVTHFPSDHSVYFGITLSIGIVQRHLLGVNWSLLLTLNGQVDLALCVNWWMWNGESVCMFHLQFVVYLY